MIFPLRVLGSPGAHCMTSGVAIGPICLRTNDCSSPSKPTLVSLPFFSVMNAPASPEVDERFAAIRAAMDKVSAN